MSERDDDRHHETAIAPPSTSSMALSFADVQRQLPAGITLVKDEGVTSLSVHIRGFVPGLALTTSSFAAYFYALAAGWIPSEMRTPLLVLAGVASVYLFVGFVFGRRRVTVDGDRLRVNSIPLPLFGDGSVPLDHVDELHVVRVGKRSGSESWRIDAVRRGGKVRHVMHDLHTSEQALVLARYLAQEHRLPAPRVVETP